jgi:hypothetical protein
MLRKSLVAAAGAGALLLFAAAPLAAAPIGSNTTNIATTTESLVVPTARRGPRFVPRVFPRGPRIFPGPRIRPGFFIPGRRIWVLPALGAAAIALTLGPGWYWGEYYDECHRWIVPCAGCAPRLVNLCGRY